MVHVRSEELREHTLGTRTKIIICSVIIYHVNSFNKNNVMWFMGTPISSYPESRDCTETIQHIPPVYYQPPALHTALAKSLYRSSRVRFFSSLFVSLPASCCPIEEGGNERVRFFRRLYSLEFIYVVPKGETKSSGVCVTVTTVISAAMSILTSYQQLMASDDGL